MARKGAIDADASGGSTQEVAKRDRLVSPVQLNVPLGGAAGQRRVPGTGAIATLILKCAYSADDGIDAR